jgi:hypothetical protein
MFSPISFINTSNIMTSSSCQVEVSNRKGRVKEGSEEEYG